MEDNMRTRRKQPRVTPAKARDWARRADDLGEKPSQIAKTDGYDVRTVRKKIAEARQQMESREARQMVVRSALERHFGSICSFAKKFKTQVSRLEPEPITSDLTGDPLWHSLKEHLPRSPIWSNIEKWSTIQKAYEESFTVLWKRIAEEAPNKAGMPFSSSAKQQGIYDGYFDAMAAHAKSIARGEPGLNGIDYRREETSHGIRLDRGRYTLAMVSENRIPSLKRSFDASLKDLENWPECQSLKRNTELFISIRSVIQDELTTIIMRRVVSGRCKYCPL
jgi:hypothetical protein